MSAVLFTPCVTVLVAVVVLAAVVVTAGLAGVTAGGGGVVVAAGVFAVGVRISDDHLFAVVDRAHVDLPTGNVPDLGPPGRFLEAE